MYKQKIKEIFRTYQFLSNSQFNLKNIFFIVFELQNSYQQEASILNSKDIQGNHNLQQNKELVLSTQGGSKINKKDIQNYNLYTSAKSAQIKASQIQLQLQLQQNIQGQSQIQLHQQQLSQQLQNANLQNIIYCSKSQLHDELISEMISQPHLNPNQIYEQVNYTNPNSNINNNNTNNLNSGISQSFQYNTNNNIYIHHQNQIQNNQSLIPSQYQQTSFAQNQNSNKNNKNNSVIQNIKISQNLSNNQSGILGAINMSAQVDEVQDQQINAHVYNCFLNSQQQDGIEQNFQNRSEEKEISIHNLGQYNISSIIQNQANNFYTGVNSNMNQSSPTDLASLNGNQKKFQKYFATDEMGRDITEGTNNQQGINAILSYPSKLQFTQTKMSEITKEETNPYFSNLILKATHSEFGRPINKAKQNQLTENHGESEFDGECVFGGEEFDGGVAVMNGLTLFQNDNGQFYIQDYNNELQQEEESERVKSYREGTESIQSQQICLDDLNDEEEDKEQKNCENSEEREDNKQNDNSEDLEEKSNVKTNDKQSNVLNEDQIIALKKTIVKEKNNFINQQNKVDKSSQKFKDLKLNIQNNQIDQNKKNKPRISFSPSIEQKHILEEQVEHHEKQRYNFNEQNDNNELNQNYQSHSEQKQQKGIIKQKESLKISGNEEVFYKIPSNNFLNSFGSVANMTCENGGNDAPISSNNIKYNISFGKAYKEEFLSQVEDDQIPRYSQQLQIEQQRDSLAGIRITSPRENMSQISVSGEIHSCPNQNISADLNIQDVLEFQHQGGVFFKNRRSLRNKNLSSLQHKDDQKITVISQNTSQEITREFDLLSPIQKTDQYFNQKQSLLQNKLNSIKNGDLSINSLSPEYYFENEDSYRKNQFKDKAEIKGRTLFKFEQSFKNEHFPIDNNVRYYSQTDANYENDYACSALSSNKLLEQHQHSKQNGNNIKNKHIFLQKQEQHNQNISLIDNINNFCNVNRQSILQNNKGIQSKSQGDIQNFEQIEVDEEEIKQNKIHNSQKDNYNEEKIIQKVNYPIILTQFNENTKYPYPLGSSSSKHSQFAEHILEFGPRSISTVSSKKGGFRYFFNQNHVYQKNLSYSGLTPHENDHKAEIFQQSPQNTQSNSMINLYRETLQQGALDFVKNNQKQQGNFEQHNQNQINSQSKVQNDQNIIMDGNIIDKKDKLDSDVSECQKIPESLTFTNQLALSTQKMEQTKQNISLVQESKQQQQNTRNKNESLERESPDHMSPIGAISLLQLNNQWNSLLKKNANSTAKYNSTNQINNTPSHQTLGNIFSNVHHQTSLRSIQDNIVSAGLKTPSCLTPLMSLQNANTPVSTTFQNMYNHDEGIIEWHQYPQHSKQRSIIDQSSQNAIYSREEFPIFSNDFIEGSSNPTRQGGQTLNTKTYSAIAEKQTMAEFDQISMTNNTPISMNKDYKFQNQPPRLKQSHSVLQMRNATLHTQPSMSVLLPNQKQIMLQQNSHQDFQKDQSYFQFQRLSTQPNQQQIIQGGLYSPSMKSNHPLTTQAGASFYKNQTNFSNESFQQTNNQIYPKQLNPSSAKNSTNYGINIGNNQYQAQKEQIAYNNTNLYFNDSHAPKNPQTNKRNSNNQIQIHKVSSITRNSLNTVPNINFTNGNLPNYQMINGSNITTNNIKNNNTMTNYTTPFYFEKRYCKFCNFDQPTRSKHCLLCNKCISTYDHHCPWIGVCIAQRNHLIFFFYVVLQNIVTGFIISDLIIFIKETVDWEVVEDIIKTVFCIISIFFLIYIFGMTLMLIFQHTYYIINNLTTWEYYSWDKITYLKEQPRKLGSPFSLGALQNIKHLIKSTFSSETYEWEVNKLRIPQYTNNLTIQPEQ